MHSTRHNQLKFSTCVYVQQKREKKRGGGVTIYNRRAQTSSRERATTKSDLVTAPNIHTSRWVENPTKTGRGSVNKPFPTGRSCTKRVAKMSINTSSLNSSRQDGEINDRGRLSVSSRSHSYVLLYNWSVRSTESYHGHIIQHREVDRKESGTDCTQEEGWGGDTHTHNPTVCLLSSSSLWDRRHVTSSPCSDAFGADRRVARCSSTWTPHRPVVSKQRYFICLLSFWETCCVTFFLGKQTQGEGRGVCWGGGNQQIVTVSFQQQQKRIDTVLVESYAEWQNH